MIEIRINNILGVLRFGDEEPMLIAELARYGYVRGLLDIRNHWRAVMEGEVRIQRTYSHATMEVVYLYTPSRKDILFKRFKKPLTPWQETKNIRFRRFQDEAK